VDFSELILRASAPFRGGAGRLLATHLGPGDPTLLSHAAWNKALSASARSADYRVGMTLGADLMRIQVPRKK